MAGTAAISSSFVISFVPSSVVATTITNPGRSFRIVGVSGNNTTGGALALNLTDGTSDLVKTNFSCPALTTTWAELTSTDALLEIASTEDLVVTCAGTGLSPVSIHCVATGGGEALTAAD